MADVQRIAYRIVVHEPVSCECGQCFCDGRGQNLVTCWCIPNLKRTDCFVQCSSNSGEEEKATCCLCTRESLEFADACPGMCNKHIGRHTGCQQVSHRVVNARSE